MRVLSRKDAERAHAYAASMLRGISRTRYAQRYVFAVQRCTVRARAS